MIAETVVGLSSVQLRDFDPRNRAEPADRVHHMEAIDRAHQFRVGGLHRVGRFPLSAVFLFGSAELISVRDAACQPRGAAFLGYCASAALDSASKVGTDLIRIADKNSQRREHHLLPGGDHELSPARAPAACLSSPL